jgi:hypothetical protein
VTWYKFCRRGAVAPFTGWTWTRAWSAGTGRESCVRGVHACGRDQLPYWLHDELWVVELSDDVEVSGRKAVASRGRLLERVGAWDAGTAAELARACVVRVATCAAEACGDPRLGAVARDLRARPEALADLRSAATDAQTGAARQGRLWSAAQCQYVVDAVDCVSNGLPVASTAYVAARAAGTGGAGDGDGSDGVGDAYEAERRWQADWLTERLALAP